MRTPDAPNIIAHPPVIFANGVGWGFVLDRLIAPLPITQAPQVMVLGWALLALAGVLAVLSLERFHRFKTDVRPWKPTTAIIANGVYRLSRNPIYLGMALAHAGCGLLLDSWWILIFLALVLPVIHFGVIKREEAYLEAKFGDAYRDYKKTVRRWL